MDRCASLVVAMVGIAAGPAPAAVTLTSLLTEMTDRAAVASLPDPDWRLRQASSHDPRKNDPGNAETWHTNQDHGNFLHVETNEGRREWVIFDADGPGAVTRWWIPLLAEKDQQVVRFYVDGATAPAFSAKYNELLAGQGPVKPPLAFIGWNQRDLADQLKPDYKAIRGVSGDLYLPIPFARHLKITVDQAPFYYIINYRAYAPGTVVESFGAASLEAAKPAIERASTALLAPPPAAAEDAKSSTVTTDRPLTCDLPAGPAAVTQVRLRLDPAEAPKAMRSLVLAATFDGEETVWCPVGEFFGCGPRFRPVRDWYRSVDADGLFSVRWVMPYARTARLRLLNLADTPVQASLSASTGPWTWTERSLLFHATWRGQTAIKTRPMSDWNFLSATGRGAYVGDTLSVYSPVKDWYGEGDERVYYDGATFPQHIGTGTEDYYGFAWGMPDYFSSPFLTTTERDIADRGDWRGYTSTSRLRLLDAIPFGSDLRHDMEIWNWADTQVDYAVGCFWYARPGATCNREPQPAEALAPIKDAPGVKHLPGAVEAEKLTPAATSPGLRYSTQNAGLQEGEWSGGGQLFVQATKVGDWLELDLPAPDNQPRALSLWLTRSRDYGILRFTVNGQPAGADWDGYSTRAVIDQPVSLGTFTPQGGHFRLRLEVVGANAESTGPRYYFGLDCAIINQP